MQITCCTVSSQIKAWKIGLDCFVSFPVWHNTSLTFRCCSCHRIKSHFSKIHNFLPNPGRILLTLTFNGLNGNAAVCQDFAENEEI